MAQGGGKTTDVVPKRVVNKTNNYYQNKLATQPCPNDKWGKK